MPDTSLPAASGAGVSDRWLVGVDGSSCSTHAAEWAAKHVGGRASELHIASAWTIPVATTMSPMSPAGPSATSETFAAVEQSARIIVEELAERVSPTTTARVTQRVIAGGAASALLDAASSSDLLIVGSRGRGGFARLVMGSTSTQCATHSPVPVAVIPTAAPIDSASNVVVAFDGSVNARAALRWAVQFARPGSRIACVSVWDPTPMSIGADHFVLPDASGLAQERFEHQFASSMADVERTDVHVRHHFIEGRARSDLAEHAETCDLLVMGARGHGAVGTAILGSVSTWLLHRVRRPMVIVPHQGEPTEVDGADVDEED